MGGLGADVVAPFPGGTEGFCQLADLLPQLLDLQHNRLPPLVAAAGLQALPLVLQRRQLRFGRQPLAFDRLQGFAQRLSTAASAQQGLLPLLAGAPFGLERGQALGGLGFLLSASGENTIRVWLWTRTQTAGRRCSTLRLRTRPQFNLKTQARGVCSVCA